MTSFFQRKLRLENQTESRMHRRRYICTFVALGDPNLSIAMQYSVNCNAN